MAIMTSARLALSAVSAIDLLDLMEQVRVYTTQKRRDTLDYPDAQNPCREHFSSEQDDAMTSGAWWFTNTRSRREDGFKKLRMKGSSLTRLCRVRTLLQCTPYGVE